MATPSQAFSAMPPGLAIDPVAEQFRRAAFHLGGDDATDPRLHPPKRYRAVFLSDVHLGTASCRAGDLVAFLDHIETEYLYLVGDLFDCWKMGGLDLFEIHRLGREQTTVLQKLFKLNRHGVKIVYIPGNHDENFRDKLTKALPVNGFAILFEATHDTRARQRFLIMHGDSFDEIVHGHRWLGILGTRIYEGLARLSVQIDKWRANARVNGLFKSLGLREEWSLAHAIRSAANADGISASYEKALLGDLFARNAAIAAWNRANRRYPRVQPYDGVICGHTHIPVRKEVASPPEPSGTLAWPETVTVANTGCWVGRPGRDDVGESWRDTLKHPICTAMVEHIDGRLEHVHWVPGTGIVLLDARYDDGSFKVVPAAPPQAALRRSAS